MWKIINVTFIKKEIKVFHLLSLKFDFRFSDYLIVDSVPPVIGTGGDRLKNRECEIEVCRLIRRC